MKFASRSALPLQVVALRRSAPVTNGRPRARSRVAVAAAAAEEVPMAGAIAGGKSFGRKRIEHAIELVGAAIMMAAFLVLALLA